MGVELTRVGSILAKLNEETDPPLTAFFEPLQAAADLMRAALDAHHAAFHSGQMRTAGFLDGGTAVLSDIKRRGREEPAVPTPEAAYTAGSCRVSDAPDGHLRADPRRRLSWGGALRAKTDEAASRLLGLGP
jgi:hypothetical protein